MLSWGDRVQSGPAAVWASYTRRTISWTGDPCSQNGPRELQVVPRELQGEQRRLQDANTETVSNNQGGNTTHMNIRIRENMLKHTFWDDQFGEQEYTGTRV